MGGSEAGGRHHLGDRLGIGGAVGLEGAGVGAVGLDSIGGAGEKTR
jgi:hypothetical protein